MLNQSKLKSLKINCKECSGLCCTALYFSKIDGFPQNKKAGVPCQNLCEDFSCEIHSLLAQKKMHGCIAYDCFGAGQKVTKDLFANITWRESKEQAKLVFDTFLNVFQLHQMLWYLLQAQGYTNNENLGQRLEQLIEQNNTKVVSKEYQQEVNQCLKEVYEEVKRQYKTNLKPRSPFDFAGKDLRKMNLQGADLSSALLIASNMSGCDLRGVNLIGADLRDANLCGANLEHCLFLTQGQINSAKIDKQTKLPKEFMI